MSVTEMPRIELAEPRCRKHEWAAAFTTPDGVDAFSTWGIYESERIAICRHCGAFGVWRLNGSGDARRLPKHEVEAYGLADDLARYRKVVEYWRSDKPGREFARQRAAWDAFFAALDRAQGGEE